MKKSTNQIQQEIEDNILIETPEAFTDRIEDIVQETGMSYIDAVSDVMTKEDYEPESIPKLITPGLLLKLELEAEKLSLLKEKKNRLDI